jgi:molybdopterin synthase catalytic subunit
MQEVSFRVEITNDLLEVNKHTDFVNDPSAGAIATFMGVTRNNFNGKKVERLEYEAYEPMAQKILDGLCREALDRWSVKKISIAHRTGRVEVGEASVIIAVSSAHRAEALQAVHWLIDELKGRAPIWKKEYYEGGEVWKENTESQIHSFPRIVK